LHSINSFDGITFGVFDKQLKAGRLGLQIHRDRQEVKHYVDENIANGRENFCKAFEREQMRAKHRYGNSNFSKASPAFQVKLTVDLDTRA
jgi:hypothetical protein